MSSHTVHVPSQNLPTLTQCPAQQLRNDSQLVLRVGAKYIT